MTRAQYQVIVALSIAACLWAASLAPGCKPLPPAETVTEDDTAVVVVVPDPEPEPQPDPPPAPPVDGTPCERACLRYLQLACEPPMSNCVETCIASDDQGLAFSWQPELQSHSVTCAEWNRRATEAR